MSISRSVMVMTLVGAVVSGSACTQKAADETTNATNDAVDRTKQASDTALEATRGGAVTAIEETREAGEQTADASRNIALRTGDKTKEIATAVGDKTKEVVSATGEVITDGWITTRVSARFVDESQLKGSNINVDTSDHVVTLKGTVRTDAAKARAEAIARGTEGVSRVVNQIVVAGA